MHTSADIGLAETIISQPAVFAALVFGSLVFGVLAVVLAGWAGWSRSAAGLVGVGLALALSVTLVRPGSHAIGSEHPLSACLRGSFSLLGSQQVLNFVMLMPFAFFAATATRRPIVISLLCAMISAGIELTQSITGIGVCEESDWLNNTIGAVLAALLGWALSSANRPRVTRDRLGT
ncbi:MAG: VanZ family protein [Sciscionella sp.]